MLSGGSRTSVSPKPTEFTYLLVWYLPPRLPASGRSDEVRSRLAGVEFRISWSRCSRIALLVPRGVHRMRENHRPGGRFENRPYDRVPVRLCAPFKLAKVPY